MEGYSIIKNVTAVTTSAGIKMWEIHSDNVMMTYFELQPYCGHDMHSHENEQITYIIEGEMDIEIGNVSHMLTAGDAIVIPSAIPHKTYAREKLTKTIDCWYPVRKDFISNT